MKKKIAILTAVMVAGFSFGVISVTFARVIPGVDRPYDPTAYYSLTEISWADSAPSTFALRDLVSNGGQVYDYTRHIKSILFGDTFENIGKVAGDMTSAEEKNTENWSNSSISSTIARTLSLLKGLGSNHMNKDGSVVDNGSWDASSINSANQRVLGMLGNNLRDNATSYNFSNNINGLFWGVPSSEDEAWSRSSSIENQNAWLENTYAEIGNSAKNIMSDQQQMLLANEYAQELSAEADGKVKAQIAQSMAQAVLSQAIDQRSAIAGKLAQMRAIGAMVRVDEEQRSLDIVNSSSFYTIDPYNKEIYDYVHKTYGVEKLQGHGMPDFK
jgi:hypothetical protein